MAVKAGASSTARHQMTLLKDKDATWRQCGGRIAAME